MSTATTDEEYIDDVYGYSDHYGFDPPSPTAPQPSGLVEANASSGDSNGKGKAKAQDNTDDDAATKPEAATELTEERKRNLAEVRQLDILDDYSVASLTRTHPTPVSSLPTATKLIKAISLITNLHNLRSYPPVAHLPSYAGDHARQPDPFPVATLAAVVELLGSALTDVNAVPAASFTSNRDQTVYELQLARARMLLKPQNEVPFEAFGRGWADTRAEPTPEQKKDRDLANLFSDNARACLLLLCPSILDSSATTDGVKQGAAVPSSTASDGDTSTAPKSCPIGKLPSELLALIFSFARAACEERPDNGMYAHPTGYEDEYHLMPQRVPRRSPGIAARGLEGSRTAAQRFTLSLALVCSDWREVARSVAFASIHIRKPLQMAKLLRLFDSVSPAQATTWTEHIQAINAKVPVPAPDPTVVSPTRSTRFNVIRANGAAALVGGAWTIMGGTSSNGGASGSNGATGEDETPGGVFALLVKRASNLKTLELSVVGHAYSIPFGSRHAGADFLESPILASLSGTPSLTTLSLTFAVDFEELEVILAGLPALEALRLHAVDNIAGAGTVTSTTPHPATELRIFCLGDPTSFRDFSSVTDVQLAWLLEPAARNRKLEVIEVNVMTNGNGAWGGGGPGGAWNMGGGAVAQGSPPFASRQFADLLVLTAPSLQRLILRDLQSTGLASPSFAAAPHNNNFDHALSRCTKLRELSLQFDYTGAGLLDSLRASPSLESLSLMGSPVHTSATELANRLEGVEQFQQLQRLLVSGQFYGRGGVVAPGMPSGWTGAEVRRLKTVCRERKPTPIQCAFLST